MFHHVITFNRTRGICGIDSRYNGHFAVHVCHIRTEEEVRSLVRGFLAQESDTTFSITVFDEKQAPSPA